MKNSNQYNTMVTQYLYQLTQDFIYKYLYVINILILFLNIMILNLN